MLTRPIMDIRLGALALKYLEAEEDACKQKASSGVHV
jgi:hypothetical protein